ncbi:MAG: hypothetical protein AAB576_03300 [Elusimicrobiota bacterium]
MEQRNMSGRTDEGKEGQIKIRREAAKGGSAMNTVKMKKGLGLMLALVLGMAVGQAWADPNTSNDKDSLTITIQPNVDLGVDVDTGTTKFVTAGGNLTGTMALGATDYLVSPASVTILGNFNNQEVELAASGLDTWGIDADEAAEADKVQLYALFAVNKTSRPVEGEFGQGADARHLVTGAKMAGETLAGVENNDLTGNQFEIANADMTSGTNMDALTVGTLKQLWLRLDAPPTTTSDENQRIVVTLTAKSGLQF